MPSKNALAIALKARIRRDNPDFFTPEDWEGDSWLDVALGRFYAEDEETVDVVVFEETRDLLATEQRELPGTAKEQLVDRVTADTVPPDAVDEMFTAAQLAVPKKRKSQISN